MLKAIHYRKFRDYATDERYMALDIQLGEFGRTSWVACHPETCKVLATGRDINKPTDEEIIEAIKACRRVVSKGYRLEPFFVRFGDLPANGYSTNHSTSQPEQGVSVVQARQNLLTGDIELMPYGSAASWLWVKDRPLYEVTGEYIGRGSDGEPLLSNCQIVRQL